MKRFFWMLLTLAMLFSLTVTQATFAVEVESNQDSTSTVTEEGNEEVRPYGSLSGSAIKEFGASNGTSQTGTFTVSVSGIPWTSAKVKIRAALANRNNFVRCKVYNPSGTLVWNMESAITAGEYAEKAIVPGSTGTYTILYEAFTMNGSSVQGGAILVDIF